jgi:hypothetical protein
MRKYFDMVGKKIGNVREKMHDYWRRLMNHSNRTKSSEGTQEIKRLITSAHKDQWRRNTKKSE